jgi:hypothetical protein
MSAPSNRAKKLLNLAKSSITIKETVKNKTIKCNANVTMQTNKES